MVLGFEERKWVGAVQITGTFDTLASSSSFFIKALFGKVTGKADACRKVDFKVASVERCVEINNAETPKQPDPKSLKWWTKKLDEKLGFLDRKATNMAFMFQSFEIRGRVGITFSLSLPTRLISVGFEIAIELTTDCLLASLEQDQKATLAKGIATHKLEKQKAKEKRANKRPLRKLAKRIEERKANEKGTDKGEEQQKEKDDVALEKMLLSVQAIKLKFDSLAWYGLITVRAGLGIMSFYVQVTTYRTQLEAGLAKPSEQAVTAEIQEDSDKLVADVVALVDSEYFEAGAALTRAADSTADKKAFGKRLNKAVKRIKAAGSAGFCGVQTGASFSFYVFGFGLEVELYVDVAKVESNMGW